jgi:NAD(P)-dependent dehydrogenase (short-subunit alcohol dehydrogenase family)
LVRITDEEWRRLVAIHVDGTFYCSRAAVRHWRRAAPASSST